MTWMDVFVFAIVFILSFCSVHNGGFGLLTRPTLILLGLPPAIAIGSFRVANLAGRMTGFSAVMQRHGMRMDWKLALWLFLPSLIGGFAGAELVRWLSPDALKKVIGAFIIVMGVVFLLKREVGLIEKHEPITKAKNAVGFVATVIVGLIAAFIGGSGVLFTYLLMFVYNKSYLSSAPIRKVANFASALSAAIFFIIYGFVKWKLVLVILIAGITGEFCGAKFQIKKGEEWIRAATACFILLTGITMLFI